MATWTTMTPRSIGDLITEADFDALQDNLTFLLGMGNIEIVTHDNGGNYTRNSAVFGDVDGANYTSTVTTYGGPVLLIFQCTLACAVAAMDIGITFDIDGADMVDAGVYGIHWTRLQDTSEWQTVTVWHVEEGLSAGSHTFKPTWRNDATGNAQMKSDSANEIMPTFIVISH